MVRCHFSCLGTQVMVEWEGPSQDMRLSLCAGRGARHAGESAAHQPGWPSRDYWKVETQMTITQPLIPSVRWSTGDSYVCGGVWFSSRIISCAVVLVCVGGPVTNSLVTVARPAF